MQAKGVVNKEAWRRSTRELQPYGSGSDIGQEDIAAAAAAHTDSGGRREGEGGGAGRVEWERGMKRTNFQEEDEEEEEEGTEVDEDEGPPTLDESNHHHHHHQGTNQDEFPAVFQSPNLTQPELFHRPTFPTPQRTQNPNQAQTGRLTRGLPSRIGGGRTLGKTVSAPVGSLWGGDVDMDTNTGGEDGFDISVWAKEEF